MAISVIGDYSDTVVLFLSTHKRIISEVMVAVLSIIVHLFDARQHILSRILVFPGLLLNVYVYSVRNILGKVLYSLVSIFINLYAYWQWREKRTKPSLTVTKTSSHSLLLIMSLGLFGALAWAIIIRQYMPGPLMAVCCDAVYTFFGFVEKWFMAHKKVERWLLSLVRYILFSITCYHKDAMIPMIQHFILVGIAIYGQVKWYRSYTLKKSI